MTSETRDYRGRSRRDAWRRLACLALCLLLAGCSPAAVAGPTPEPTIPRWTLNLAEVAPDPWVMAWEYRPTELEAVPPGVNVICPTWLYIEQTETGTAVLKNIGDMGYSAFDAETYVAAAHRGGAQVWGCVVSFEAELSRQVVVDMDIQRQVIEGLVDYVGMWNLDGINIDFERMDPQNKALFTQFCANLKETLGDKPLSVCVTPPIPSEAETNWYQAYDRAALAQVVDYVTAMTYDAHKEAFQPVAEWEWLNQKIKLLLEEIPSEKLVMGVPFYGVDYINYETTQDGPGEDEYRVILPRAVEKLLAEGVLTLGEETYEAVQWITQGRWRDDFRIQERVFVDQYDNMHTIWVEDALSLAEKKTLVQEYRLAGIGVWRMRFGTQSMWEAMAFD